MRIWHVSLVMAMVLMLFAGQTVWAQDAPKPVEDVPAAGDADAGEGDVDTDKVKKDVPDVGDDDAGDSDDDAGDSDDDTDEGEGAATKPGGKGGFGGFGDMQFFIIMIAVMALLWWWMGRGRRKEQQKHKEMLSTLKKGDKVTSIGGIIGTVIDVKDREVVVKVDESSNTRMKFLRSAIRNVGTLGGDDSSAGDSKK